MVDPRTQASLRELNMAVEQNKKVMNAAEQICTCTNCIEARMKKTIPPCEQSKRMQEIHGMIIPPVPGHYALEYDPAHWRNQKSIRMTRLAF
jgi:hypothetical protein